MPGGEATQVTSTSIRGFFEISLVTLNSFLALLIMAVYGVSPALSKLLKGPQLFFILFALWATLSAMWSPAPVLSAAKGIQLFGVAIICAVISTLARRSRIQGALLMQRTLLTIIVVLLAINVVVHGTPLPYTDDYRPRFFLGFGHSLSSGMILALGIIATVFASKATLVSVIIISALGMLLLFADARGPTAGLLVALLCAFWWFLFRKPFQWFRHRAGLSLAIAAHLTLIAIITTIVGFTPLPSVALNYIFQEIPDARSLNGRLEVWALALEVTRDHLITGVGYFATRFYLIDAISWGPGQAHNAFFETLMSLGLVGILLFMGFYITLTLQAVQEARKQNYLPLTILICVSIQGILSPTLIAPNLPTAITLLAITMTQSVQPKLKKGHHERFDASQLLPATGW
ncbi:MAG: O-antigen ligase family protein [Desulfurococcaceae archaeon]